MNVKPVFTWRGNHLFCGQLCLTAYCDDGKGGFMITHMELEMEIVTFCEDGVTETFRKDFENESECRQFLFDVYADLLGRLETTIKDGKPALVYCWPNHWDEENEELMTNDMASIFCGEVDLGSLSNGSKNSFCFHPSSFSLHFTRATGRWPVQFIVFDVDDGENHFRKVEKIIEQVMSTLEFE